VANCSSVAKMARQRIYCQTDGFDFLPSTKTTLPEGTLFLFSVAVNLTYSFVVSLAVDLPPFQLPESDCEFCVLFHCSSSYTDKFSVPSVAEPPVSLTVSFSEDGILENVSFPSSITLGKKCRCLKYI